MHPCTIISDIYGSKLKSLSCYDVMMFITTERCMCRAYCTIKEDGNQDIEMDVNNIRGCNNELSMCNSLRNTFLLV